MTLSTLAKNIKTVCNNGAAAPVANLLTLNDLRLEVHLGWTDEERARPQPVELNLFIRFPETPAACETDDLAGTVCYAKICSALTESIRGKPFKLIEKLAAHLCGVARAQLPAGSRVLASLTKIEVPVQNLLGGATFSYGDEI